MGVETDKEEQVMSLPAWNRKAPSRAVIVATLSTLTVFGASSLAVADVTQQQPHNAPTYGQPAAAGYGFPGQQLQGGYANYGFAAPTQQGYGAPVQQGYGAPIQQGYAAPAQQGYGAPAPLPGYGAPVPASAPEQGYGAPQPFPGYGLPGQFAAAGIAGFPVPGAPGFGFDPYGGFNNASQWGNFAPSEPNYAPHERRSGTAAAAPAEPARAKVAPVAAKPAAATTSSDYSYQIAPTTGSKYVGSSTQIEPTTGTTYTDPYQALQQVAPVTQGYQATAPSYSQAYDAATSYVAPAQQTYEPVAQSYTSPSVQQNYVPSQQTYAAEPQQTYTAPQQTYVPSQQTFTAEPQQNYVPSQQTYAAEPQQTYVTAQPTYEPVQQQTFAAPAPVQPVNVGGYEYQNAQPAADYYDLNSQTAAAAAAAIAAPQQVAAYAPQQVAPTGGHVVQVGAFIDQNRAARLVNRLGAAGEQAFVVPARVRGKIYHRVRISGGSKRDARAVRNRVRELGYYEARVVKG